jgi:hypothetical protein
MEDPMLETIYVRLMTREDLPKAVKCGEEFHSYIDEDFCVRMVQEFAWTEADYIEAISQYKSTERGTNETRAYVATIEDVDGEETVLGSTVIEYGEDFFKVLVLTTHPHVWSLVSLNILEFLLYKAIQSEKRKRIISVVEDGDYKTLELFTSNKFTSSLRYNPKGNDVWDCEFILDDSLDSSDKSD